MNKRITQLITIMNSICFLFAEGSYDILKLPQDARSLALNNTTSAYDDPFMHSNPAAISMRSGGMGYSYLYLPANIHLGTIHHINNNNNCTRAAKFSILNYGTIIDSETEEKSYAVDAMLEVAYKKELKNIVSVGISGGYLFSAVSGFNSQILFSKIGARSRIFQKRLGIGFSLENMGILLKSYTDIQEPIPALFRIATYYKPMYIPLIINGDIVRKLDGNSFYFSGGLEFIYQRILTFRLGISSNRNGYLTEDFSSDIVAGVSGGFGLQFKQTTLDIGLMNLGPAGFIMGFSISNKKN